MAISWKKNMNAPGEIGDHERFAQEYLERFDMSPREATELWLWRTGELEPTLKWHVHGDVDAFSESLAEVVARFDLEVALNEVRFPQRPYAGSALTVS
jgi:hypothetical protein